MKKKKKKSVDHTSDLAKIDQRKPVEDRISELPDEIIELILSKLNSRDAICTGILSRRLKHVWEYIGTLDFDLQYEYNRRTGAPKRVDKARYISIVNAILDAHKGPTIEAFNVRYDLDIQNKLDIDRWIDFALRKKAHRLELNFTQPHQGFLAGAYKFPLLEKSNLSCLRSLSLHCVKVDGEVLNYLLSNCQFLEYLNIELMTHYNHVHFAPCPKLKHLNITAWSNVVDISSAPNLTSFIYSGTQYTTVSVKNVPNLSHVSLRGFYCEAILNKSRELPSFLFQLKKLALELQAVMIFPKYPLFPKLNNVYELKLVCTRDNYSMNPDIFSCGSLIEACPNLNRFSMKFAWSCKGEKVIQREKWIVSKCLKVVELEGFRGEGIQFDFYGCLLSSSPSLDKIIVHLSLVYNHKKKHKIAKSLRRLTRQFSPSAELFIC